MDRQGRRFARDYFWFAFVLIAILVGSAARAAAADEPGPDGKKPTTEELERRIAILEQKLEAQQQAIAALLQSQRQPAPAQRAQSADAAQPATAGETATAPPPAVAQTAATGAQTAATGAQAPATGAQAPATAATAAQHPVTVQQAGPAPPSSPAIFAGPGGFPFQARDGA